MKLTKNAAAAIAAAFKMSAEDEYYARLMIDNSENLIWITTGGSEYRLDEKNLTLVYEGSRLGFQCGAGFGGVCRKKDEAGNYAALPALEIYLYKPSLSYVSAELVECQSSTPHYVPGRNDPFTDVMNMLHCIQEHEEHEEMERIESQEEKFYHDWEKSLSR